MSNNELRVPKKRAQVEVFMPGGASRKVTVFLAEFASSHAGHERLSDLLNAAEGEFLPAVDAATDAMMFLNRESIAAARISRDWEADEDLAAAEQHDVEVVLTDGTSFTGALHFVLPPDHSRLLDFLNARQPFLRLWHDDAVTVVNKRHIARVAKVK